MIKLVVDEYCENCPEFEAHVECIGLKSIGETTARMTCNTTITCEHRAKCQSMKDYLDRQCKTDINTEIINAMNTVQK